MSKVNKKINFFDDTEPDDYDDGQYTTGSISRNDFGRGVGNMQTRMMDSKTRTVESQQRALRSIAQSEEMGVATGSELIRQREVLEKVDNQLDEMNVMQDQSQRHINSLSSIFGGFKNFFSRGKGDSLKKQAPSDEQPKSDSDARTKQLRATLTTDSDIERVESRIQSMSLQEQRPRDVLDSTIDDNLEIMGSGVSRLKSLATGLGSEIESQNELLDRIQPKVDRVNTRMNAQQKDLNRLLYGKK